MVCLPLSRNRPGDSRQVGATIASVRLAITTLEHKGKVVSVGRRPVRYCAPAKPAKFLDRGDYQV